MICQACQHGDHPNCNKPARCRCGCDEKKRERPIGIKELLFQLVILTRGELAKLELLKETNGPRYAYWKEKWEKWNKVEKDIIKDDYVEVGLISSEELDDSRARSPHKFIMGRTTLSGRYKLMAEALLGAKEKETNYPLMPDQFVFAAVIEVAKFEGNFRGIK